MLESYVPHLRRDRAERVPEDALQRVRVLQDRKRIYEADRQNVRGRNAARKGVRPKGKMIRNWDEQRLGMDFGEIGVSCSDVDMIHVTANGKLIIGEIKNAKGTFQDGQRRLLSGLIDAHRQGGVVLYITHDKDVHAGDTVVNVAECEVVEYYKGGQWFKPNNRKTVKEVLNEMEVENMGATITGKAKVWVKRFDDGGVAYSVSVSSKDKEGKWVNAYQPIRFKKEAHPERVISNGTEINYEGFATVIQGKDYNKVLWQITDFTVVGNEMASPSKNDFERFTENDIPF